MISTWKKRRAARRAGKDRREDGMSHNMELMIPKQFRCPMSLDLMKDPVILSTGITYDRESIERWIKEGNVTCPVTNQVVTSLEPTPNHAIREMIQNWCVENRSYGIERIPTPRVPVTSMQVLEINSKITTSFKRNDRVGCRNLVAKIKELIKESERNKMCIHGHGTAGVLSAAFEEFSKDSSNVAVLEEILSCLTLLSPIDGEAKRYLASPGSLDYLVWFLDGGDLSGRRNSVCLLKEIIHSMDTTEIERLSEIGGAKEALFKLIKEPICPAATKASLVVIYSMVTELSTTNVFNKVVAKFVDMGLVSLLLEMLVDAERSTCEKALGVLDAICGTEQGRDEARAHALTTPVVVKKMLRVSELGTDLSVSILWKLICRFDDGEKRVEKGVVVEALQVGYCQKLLLLLQVGCGEKTKAKATESLKALNSCRDRAEYCVDSGDFKDLKRPF